ncbi:MAG: 2-oxoglutarate dehydrogenase E1 component [Cycloclasticus sp.]|nr:2-oxoglutarate dehydrogenase E1 component [Cycloclasticus sp.]MBG97325.1 2-oxoglutarate dehydrogenase E1 component [Cycloclasticus sp.]
MNNLMQLFKSTSALNGANANFVEDLYEQYLNDPDSVDEQWREKFQSIRSSAETVDIPHSSIKKHFSDLAKAPTGVRVIQGGLSSEQLAKQAAVSRLMNAYRINGHKQANVNPLETPKTQLIAELDIAFHGLSELDLNTQFDTGTLHNTPEQLALKDIIPILKETYCASIGVEYMHISDTEMRSWVRRRMEGPRAKLNLQPEQKKWLLKLLTAAEGIENHLHRTYVGQKRFSLEGGESLIPMLDEMLQRLGEHGVKETVIGMAHRGRLNVLINIFGKKPSILFEEFEGKRSASPAKDGSGDVKYHMGFSSDINTPGGEMHLALAFNPSHLEIINPVVEGSVRARQDRRGENGEDQVVAIQIHGDSAFSGQGVIMETLQMSRTRAYGTGGTIHIVVNNQVGFTTSNPADTRSTLYATDVAKMLETPILHVNADDPEAVLFAAQLAVDFRHEFRQDIVLDMVCYRRRGHNEADEPAVTQPLMYKTIRSLPTTRKIYADRVTQEGSLSQDVPAALEADYRSALEKGEIVSRPILEHKVNPYVAKWDAFLSSKWDDPCDTTVPAKEFHKVSDLMLTLPPEFPLQNRVEKVLESRKKMSVGALPIDWGYAENMAYGTLLSQGRNIRMTGQDVGRGTFFHRHAVLHNTQNGETYTSLRHLLLEQGRFSLYDSFLSEEAVLGFEYGYSTTEPDDLVIWEAQFGDFANGAQVLMDQFISSGETKWGRLCGLVMLLPHGYEGQGPEHSSARLERYLQLCAEHNMQVCVPSTPSQIFHLLRRQTLSLFRKPLIVMSPKSLLRHKLATSTLEELIEGKFHPLIKEIDELDPKKVTRLIVCSGKVYYDLLEQRRTDGLENVAIFRAEQLYPFPIDELHESFDQYPNLKELVWCQEEPKNQGAWYQIRHRFFDLVSEKLELKYAGRPMSASPAVGQFSLHVEQQQKLIQKALY